MPRLAAKVTESSHLHFAKHSDLLAISSLNIELPAQVSNGYPRRMTLHIRPVESEDKLVWEDLFNGYLHFYKTELSQELIHLAWERLLDPHFNSFGLVAEADGEVLGICHYSFQNSTWAAKNYCYLEDLYVSPAARGQGLGRGLIDAVLEIAKKEGSSRIYWNTDTTNDTARKLYDTFVEVSEKVQYRIQLD